MEISLILVKFHETRPHHGKPHTEKEGGPGQRFLEAGTLPQGWIFTAKQQQSLR
jgi:hypothetical protein